jgi:endonuclease/exonuclease/phosphatase family metal-dependent hydrolase
MKRSKIHKISIKILFIVLIFTSYFSLLPEAQGQENNKILAKDVKAVKMKKVPKPKKTIRILYWNIQNGMWSDQANEYDNFVKWVKKYNPDVCVWCEASSIYYDYTYKTEPDSLRNLPKKWPEVAKRYGHPYTALGGWRDNYPQEVTSKYPIKTLLKITDTDNPAKPITHGAAVQQVDVNGMKLNFVTLHTWPQSYGFGVKAADRNASSANHDGDYYREYEIDYIISHTIKSPEFKDEQNWIMLGDFNSRSRVDNSEYGYAEDDTRFLCQDKVCSASGLIDAVKEKDPDNFHTSTYGKSRIDYIYVSEPIMAKVTNAHIIMDDWTEPIVSYYEHYFKVPSDHRPILMDIKL